MMRWVNITPANHQHVFLGSYSHLVRFSARSNYSLNLLCTDDMQTVDKLNTWTLSQITELSITGVNRGCEPGPNPLISTDGRTYSKCGESQESSSVCSSAEGAGLEDLKGQKGGRRVQAWRLNLVHLVSSEPLSAPLGTLDRLACCRKTLKLQESGGGAERRVEMGGKGRETMSWERNYKLFLNK